MKFDIINVVGGKWANVGQAEVMISFGDVCFYKTGKGTWLRQHCADVATVVTAESIARELIAQAKESSFDEVDDALSKLSDAEPVAKDFMSLPPSVLIRDTVFASREIFELTFLAE